MATSGLNNLLSLVIEKPTLEAPADSYTVEEAAAAANLSRCQMQKRLSDGLKAEKVTRTWARRGQGRVMWFYSAA